MISGTIRASPLKLCRVIVLLKAYQNEKKKFSKIWAGPPESRQIIYHSKGNDESVPKM